VRQSALKNGKEKVSEVEYSRYASSGVDQSSLPFVDHDSQKEYGEGEFEEEHGEYVKYFGDEEHLYTINKTSTCIGALRLAVMAVDRSERGK
jgi:hypothetical protein